MLYGLAAVLGKAEAWNLMPRVMPFMGLAHLVGGVLFGAAMGVSGLCPGTCVAKAGGRGGDKKFAAPFAVVGLVAGVLAYALLKEPLTQAGVIAAHQKPLTVYGMAGLPYGPLALAFGALMLTIAIVADRVMGEKSYAPAHQKTSLLDWMRGEWSWTAAGTIAGVLAKLFSMPSKAAVAHPVVKVLDLSLIHI